jgi:lipoate-protein ligase A
MLLKDISLQLPQENILYDEALLDRAERGHSDEVLRFWESEQLFIVLGRTSKEEEDVQIDAVRRDHIPVLRRASGGGTVLQGKGCLNYSLVLSKGLDPVIADLRRSYEWILGKIILALQNIGIKTEFCPISDIALSDGLKKISGNAQKRAKKFILHHGTILYDFDLTKIERYLKMPRAIPEYRQGRSHTDFIANIPAEVRDIKKAICDVFKIRREEQFMDDRDLECLQELLDSRIVRLESSNIIGENI